MCHVKRSMMTDMIVLLLQVGAVAATTCFTHSTAQASPKILSYSGDAYALTVSAPPAKPQVFANTGPLQPTGGSKSATASNVDVAGIATAALLNASVSGSGNESSSSASVSNLSLLGSSATPILVTAVSSQASAKPGGVMGTTVIDGLTVAGVAVNVTGTPNQEVDIPGVGVLTINEQKKTHEHGFRSIVVNALHLHLVTGFDLIVAHSSSDIAYETQAGVVYSGRAYAIYEAVPPLTSGTFADTGDLPDAGGSLQNTEAGITITGVLTTGTLTGATSGADKSAQSSASVEDLDVLTSSAIAASAVSSQSEADVSGESGSSTITGLTIGGQSVTITGKPNQVIVIPAVGTLVIDEQTYVNSANFHSITVNALHLTLTTGAQVIVAHSHSDLDNFE